MVLRGFWRNFRVARGGGVYQKNQFRNGFLFRAIISFFAYISWNNGFTAILTKFLPSSKGEEFYKKNQFPNGFRFHRIISFSAHISWNNGFTAILTKFLPFTKGEAFCEKNQFPNCFLFQALILFFAYISCNNGFCGDFDWIFDFYERGWVLWEESIPKWLSISKHNFDFCIYVVK